MNRINRIRSRVQSARYPERVIKSLEADPTRRDFADVQSAIGRVKWGEGLALLVNVVTVVVMVLAFRP